MISSFSSLSLIKKPVAAVASATNVVIIGAGTYGTARSSNSGSTWEYGTAPFSFNGNTVMCCGILNLAPLWVIVGNNGGTMTSATSTNGSTWTTSTSINSVIPGTSGAYCSCVAFGNGVFMVSGFNNSLTPNGTPVAISSDGITWVNGGYIFGSGKLTNAVAYGNGYWVAVANNAGGKTNNVRISSNVSVAGNANISWGTFRGLNTDPLYSVLYTGTRWLIGGFGGAVYYSDTNNPTSATFTLKSLNITNLAYHHVASLAISNNNIIVATTWVPGGQETATIQYLDGTDIANNLWQNRALYTVSCSRIAQIGFGGTGTFITVSNKASTPTAFSNDNGSTWNYLASINTNMATSTYAVAFAM